MTNPIKLLQLRIPVDAYDRIAGQAAVAGLSLNRYIIQCTRLNRRKAPPEGVPPLIGEEQLLKWQAAIQNMLRIFPVNNRSSIGTLYALIDEKLEEK